MLLGKERWEQKSLIEGERRENELLEVDFVAFTSNHHVRLELYS